MEYKTIKLILNKIEVKPIRTRKQINKKEKNQKKYSTYKNNGKTKVSLKTKKQIVVCVYLFSWKKKKQIKQKANQTKQKKCYLPVLRTTHANNTQKRKQWHSCRHTNHTSKENLQKYSKNETSVFRTLFLSRYLWTESSEKHKQQKSGES